MRVLFDTNILLDILLEREPYIEVASRLFSLVDNGRIKGSDLRHCSDHRVLHDRQGARGPSCAHDQVRTDC